MPLSGYRVLDLTDHRGQFAGSGLAQLGADVILVEPAGGSPSRHLAPFIDDEPGMDRSLWHWAYNRGKRSVVVDDEQLAELAAGADVLLECGARPVDLAALRAMNPALVTVSITPFGGSGPKAQWLASDLTLAAAGGILAVTGDQDRPPVRIGLPQSWLHASADALSATTIALRERKRSGLGQHVDVSCQQSLIAATQFSMMTTLVGSPPAKRVAGGLELGPFRLRFVYECADGHVSVTYLFGSVIGPYTNRLFRWMQDEGACDASLGEKNWVSFATDVVEGRESVVELERATAAIEAFTRTRTQRYLVETATAKGALIAPINTTRNILDLEHLEERGFWDHVALPERAEPVRMPGSFVRWASSPPGGLAAPPAVGAHTGEVLAQLADNPRRPAATTSRTNVSGSDSSGRALEDLKIVDLFWALAGPGATRTLADFGATVVRVESEARSELLRAGSPFRSGETEFEGSLHYHSANASKFHLQLNLSVTESREVLLDLVRWADVVTESFTPRAMRSMGLSFDLFRSVNPRIVMVSSCLMGQSGPLRDYAGFGTAGAAFAGFYPITGWPDRLPAGPYTAYTDYISPRFTVAALLAALEQRDATGEAQYVDFSQMECGLQFIAPLLLDDELHGRTAGRNGNRDSSAAPHVVVPAGPVGADQWIAVVCETDEQWRTLATLCGRADLAGLTTAERLARVDEVEAVVSAWTAGRDPGVMQEELQAAGIIAHQVQNSAECVADPQLVLRQQFRRVPHPLYGHSFVEGPAFQLSRTPGGPTWAGPTMGQHTEQVLSEMLGYDDDRIADLVVAGALS